MKGKIVKIEKDYLTISIPSSNNPFISENKRIPCKNNSDFTIGQDVVFFVNNDNTDSLVTIDTEASVAWLYGNIYKIDSEHIYVMHKNQNHVINVEHPDIYREGDVVGFVFENNFYKLKSIIQKHICVVLETNMYVANINGINVLHTCITYFDKTENKRDYLIVPDTFKIFEKLLLLAPKDDFLMFIKNDDLEPIRNIYIL